MVLELFTQCQGLVKPRFFISQLRRNSMRGKVVGQKWIYLERYTFHRKNAVCLKRQEQSQGVGSSWKVRSD